MMRNAGFLTALAFTLVLSDHESYAEGPKTSQELSGILRTEELIRKEKAFEQAITKKKEKCEEAEKPPAEEAPALPPEKVLIKNIVISGASLIPEKDLRTIVAPFENKELPLAEMQKAVDLITEAYRKKGYVTSRAYIPPQKIENNTFAIRIIEGKMGDLEVKGNRYFKTELYKKKIELKKDEPFNYYLLTKALRKINEYPDRTAKAVLVPGKDPGATDVVLEVKDDLPVHAGYDFDNYGSRYILNDRHQFTVRHNNLFGMEDAFDFKYMMSEARAYRMIGGSYVLPINEKFKLGGSASWSKLHLAKDYESLDIRGTSGAYSLFATQNVVDDENFTFNASAGFDINDVYNSQFGQKTSTDRMRVVKVGFDTDSTDPYGRTVMSHEFNVGLPGFMGGLKARDPRASRPDSGGELAKYVLNLFRLHPMPFSSMILVKNQLQVSSTILTATEQYQIGGIVNVRGYPSGEFVGDSGFSTSVEWYFPPYGVPKDLKIPYTKTSFYDAIKFLAFYDYGIVRLRRPGPNEKSSERLSDLGWGIRLNLPKNFFFKTEFAYPLGQKASDGKHMRTWLQLAANF